MALDYLGVAPDEERVYRALLSRPDGHAAELADVLSLPPGRVAVALEGLVARGLATPRAGERFSAISPDIALGSHLSDQRGRLHDAELALAELVEAYRTSALGNAERELIEVVHGPEAVQRRYLQLQLGATERIDTFVTGRPQVVSDRNTEEATVLARGIRARAVIDRDFLAEPDGVRNVEDSLGAGVEVRATSQIPLKLIVVDGRLAMLPLLGRGDGVDPSLVLRGGLAHLAQGLFDAVWARARPYGTTSEALDPVDSRIMQLLLAGFTDAAVAGQLDLSSRTVQRRISALMGRAGVASRVQLGWHAREHGWG
ncbi:LuxR C-terminal-related transcriptional regulator [Nocardioides sp. YIM 152588]|uniref:LuxR C-terminal-related transcriptional regulator n=1 Tax=Nocardioides sp. YIM 152588 TaxID=3158259 RepID=UPI0032E392FC